VESCQQIDNADWSFLSPIIVDKLLARRQTDIENSYANSTIPCARKASPRSPCRRATLNPSRLPETADHSHGSHPGDDDPPPKCVEEITILHQLVCNLRYCYGQINSTPEEVAEIIELFIARGADLNARNCRGMTVLEASEEVLREAKYSTMAYAKAVVGVLRQHEAGQQQIITGLDGKV